MSTAKPRLPRLPPPWIVHTAWRVHRALYRLRRGGFLWTTSDKRGWGALRLTTIGRKSGQERSVIIGYLEDGPDLVALAMNGWDEGNPSGWLNPRGARRAGDKRATPPQEAIVGTVANHVGLFLDELAEFVAPVLDGLRQPLEEASWGERRALPFPARCFRRSDVVASIVLENANRLWEVVAIG